MRVFAQDEGIIEHFVLAAGGRWHWYLTFISVLVYSNIREVQHFGWEHTEGLSLGEVCKDSCTYFTAQGFKVRRIIIQIFTSCKMSENLRSFTNTV